MVAYVTFCPPAWTSKNFTWLCWCKYPLFSPPPKTPLCSTLRLEVNLLFTRSKTVKAIWGDVIESIWNDLYMWSVRTDNRPVIKSASVSYISYDRWRHWHLHKRAWDCLYPRYSIENGRLSPISWLATLRLRCVVVCLSVLRRTMNPVLKITIMVLYLEFDALVLTLYIHSSIFQTAHDIHR